VWSAKLTSNYIDEVHPPATYDCISLDWGPIEIFMYNGLTNARKFRLQSRKPLFEVKFADSEDELIVLVCNMADPGGSGITCEDASHFFAQRRVCTTQVALKC
jgi:hypothetical protein